MVGSFPSATRRSRIAALVIVLSLAAALLASPYAFAKDGLKDKQRQVKHQIHSAKNDLSESSQAMQAAAAALNEAQVALGAAQVKLAETRAKLLAAQIRDRKMQAALDQAVKDLAVARAELVKGRQDVADQREAVGEMVADMYEIGSPGMRGLSSFLDAQGLDDLTRADAANEAISDEENSVLDGLEAAEVLLTVKEAKVETKKDEVEVRRQAAAENLKLMQALEQQAEDEEASVRQLVSQRQSALAAAARARRADHAVLIGLQKEEDHIAELLRRRALQQAHGPQTAHNGYLSWPVTPVRITSPFGYRYHPIYGYYALHNGVDFGASCGQPMYSAASGQVISEYYQTAYGNRLIIDNGAVHGYGLATIYNHATHYIVGVGDHVDRGQVVGYVGSTGWSTGCHLHFTVMQNGVAVDPMNWL